MSRSKVVTVALGEADRVRLTKVVTSGTHPARMIMRARVLLALDEDGGPGWWSRGRSGSRRRRSVRSRSGSSRPAVTSRPRSAARRANPAGAVGDHRGGRGPADRVGLHGPAAGYARWSLRLLEKHVALVEDVPNLDHTTIGRVLKKRNFVLI